MTNDVLREAPLRRGPFAFRGLTRGSEYATILAMPTKRTVSVRIYIDNGGGDYVGATNEYTPFWSAYAYIDDDSEMYEGNTAGITVENCVDGHELTKLTKEACQALMAEMAEL